MKLLAALTSLRPGKTWIVFGVALAVGLLAALAARSYLSRQMAEIEARGLGPTVAVVVAKGNLKKSERLSSDNLAVRPIPADFAHSLAVRPEQFESIDGKVLTQNVKSGEAILQGMWDAPKAPTFSARVASGHRAMTVPVDEINSISGMLEPGDLIDLIVTIDQKGRKNTFPLLQGVTVMATGQRSVDDPRSGERRMYSTVTIDTDVQQAQNIIVAREAGKLTALLRNPQDKAPIEGGAVDLAALLGGKGRPGGDAEVPVLYGGTGGRFPPEGLRLGRYVSPARAATPPMHALAEAGDTAGSGAGVLSGGKPGTQAQRAQP